MPPNTVSTANTTRHSTGSVLVARANAPQTPAKTRPWVGRTSPLRQANAVSGGGSGPVGPGSGAEAGPGGVSVPGLVLAAVPEGSAGSGPAAGPAPGGGCGGRSSVMLLMVDPDAPQIPRVRTLSQPWVRLDPGSGEFPWSDGRQRCDDRQTTRATHPESDTVHL